MRIKIRDVLVVHNDSRWFDGVSRQLRTHGARAHGAESPGALRRVVSITRCDAALFDVRAMPPPRWFLELENLMRASPAPATVAWGEGLTVYDGFHLARMGVRQFLAKRPTAIEVCDVIAQAIAAEPVLEPHVRAFVGHAPLTTVVDRVRDLFLDQALGLMRDDRSKSSRLLGVSRQAVQQMIRRRARRADGVTVQEEAKKPRTG